MDLLISFTNNYIAQAAFFGWFSAQVIKFIIVLCYHHTLQWERLVGPGGFPSSHTSFVVATTAALGIKNGIHSDIFALAIVVSCIVMYDASSVRLETGKQAQVLNQIMAYFRDKAIPVHLNGHALKELLGHTPIEVMGGLILGIIVAFIQYYCFYDGVL